MRRRKGESRGNRGGRDGRDGDGENDKTRPDKTVGQWRTVGQGR